jgi:hypothetical protein
MRPLRPALAIAAFAILVTACSSNAVLPSPGPGPASAVSRGCAHLSRHQYEVCYAYLVTVETWLVRTEPANGGKPGRVLFAETNARHTVILDRTPTMLCVAGHCLHKWVVVRIG